MNTAPVDHPEFSSKIGTYVERVFVAMREGGLDMPNSEGINIFGPHNGREYELFRETRHGYTLTVAIAATVDREGEAPRGSLTVELKMPGSIDAAVALSRRTDRDRWDAQACGTDHLPIGHVLGELAHGPKFLGLDKTRMRVELADDHRLFLCLMEMGRIFRTEP